MISLILEKIPRVLKSRKRLEKDLEVKIDFIKGKIILNGTPEKEYVANKVIEALEFGFPFKAALSIAKEEYVFTKINIKDYTEKKDFKRIRARIIGRKGVTLKTLYEISECNFELNGNEIGIIGEPEEIEAAQRAVISIIRGAKQGNVYRNLEKQKPLPLTDLGLKEKEEKFKDNKL
jgi:KH domain-containing protein